VRAALAAYGAKATWAGGLHHLPARHPRRRPVRRAERPRRAAQPREGRARLRPRLAAPGETFGAEGLTPRASYATDARAEDASETLHVSGAALRSFLREQPPHGQAVLGQVMAERSEMLEKLRELATLSVEERLIASMVRLAERAPAVRTDRAVDPVTGAAPLVLGANEYRLLCELVGATRESVSLVFTRLAAAGLVERDGAHYTVPDVAALSQRLGAVWQEADATVPVSREPAVGGRTARV
jgi:CRP-like cAMP-binding protein